MGPEDQTTITYTVKELLADISVRVTEISTKLDHKADKADVATLEGRVSTLERFKDKAMGAALVLAASGSAAGYALKEILG